MSNKNKKFITPLGVAKFPALVEPDTKFNPDGVYKTGLLVDEEAAEPLAKAMTECITEFKERTLAEASPKRRKKLESYTVKEHYQAEIDDDGEETGLVCFKLSLQRLVKPKGKPDFYQELGLFDTKNKRIPREGLRIWGGTTFIAAGELVPYCLDSAQSFGVSLRMRAVQIHDLRSGGDSPEGYGFEATGTGYTAESTFEEAAQVTTSEDADEEEDF